MRRTARLAIHKTNAVSSSNPSVRSSRLKGIDFLPIYAYYAYMTAAWDPKKAQANFRKHGVRFSDAETALMDPNATSREDPTADDERRSCRWGWTPSEGLWWWCTPTARRRCG
jgi:uncharacterized DUF497 family protein